jgi:PAS domain S-box-containing protein
MISKIKPLLKYFFSSFVLFATFLGIIFLLYPSVRTILSMPENEFDMLLTFNDLQMALLFVFLVLTSFLVSYIVFLRASTKARIEMEVSRATEWLAISREQFRRLYDGAPVPYLTLDKSGVVLEPNKAALRFFGVTTEEINGVNLFSLHPEEDQEKSKQLQKNYELNMPINGIEARMVTKNGLIKTVLLSVFDMKSPINSERIGLATVFDITEQKRLDQAKTQFLSLASHQMRTPLATIKWLTEMLMSDEIGKLTIKQKDYIERLFEVNKGAIELVNVLLNVSRIEIGTLTAEIKNTNVEELSESVLNENLPQIERKKIHIEKEYGGMLNNLSSDPKLLRIVIHNLITNAIKYTPENGTIKITFNEGPDGKKIIVSDTGLGIPKNQQDRVFTKLFRAENVANIENGQSTGLGLYMVKSIMETLGGKISFVSEENKGSVFTIIL